jgi:hypothetical protein
MKIRIAAGCGLLLVLGTAMAGTWIYEQEKVPTANEVVLASAATERVTPEMIARWKATSASAGYIAPRVPL